MTEKYALMILLLATFLFGEGCSKKSNIYLDNASAVSVEADIDGIRYNITAGESRNIDIKAGVHKISAKSLDGKWQKDTTFQVQKGGIVNLNQGKYTVWRELYGDDSLRAKKLNIQWVNFDKTPLMGDFTRYDSSLIFIEKAWDYDLSETFPDEKMGFIAPTSKEKFMVKAKVYREADLVKEYTGMAQEQGIKSTTPPPSATPQPSPTPPQNNAQKKHK